jgi:hypothetical protein
VHRATSTINVTAQLIIATYQGRRKGDTSPPVDGQSFGPRIWRGKINTGYVLGDNIVKSPEEVLEVAFEYDDAKAGELDIIVAIDSEANIPESAVRDIAAPTSYRLISYINFSLGDIIVPTAPFQILRVLGPGKFQLERSFTMPVRQRRSVEEQEANSILNRFLQQRTSMQIDEAAYLDVASRRYITALEETDPVDKFCDFWEACEFLSKKTLGTKAAAIAKLLSDHIQKRKEISKPSSRYHAIGFGMISCTMQSRSLILLREIYFCWKQSHVS